jgi:hypothetical protein
LTGVKTELVTHHSTLRSIETAQNVALDFLCFAYELAAQKGFAECDVAPDDIWNEAELAFDWNKCGVPCVDGIKPG